MTKLVFYGGVNEIGGNKILLSDSGTQVLLDFGLSFGMKDKYYDQYLGPRGFAIINEYVAFGFLPAIKGAYREDHLKHIDPSHPLLGSKSVDAVLISHAHLDHIGMIPYLKPDIRLILKVDEVYRRRAGAGQLPMIAPKRFNPDNKAWLPILHTTHEGLHFTVLYSNTARAHSLNRVHDWVVIYFYDDHHREGQHTVVTETHGSLKGKRVVRGREAECETFYDEAAGGR